MTEERDRDMDRHGMLSEVGYLFSGLWKGRGEGRRAERRGEKERGERETKGGRGEVGRDRSCLFEREMEKEETQAASRKEDLPASVDGDGSGRGLSL